MGDFKSGIYSDGRGSTWFCAQTEGTVGVIIRCEGQTGPSAHYFTAANPATFKAWGWKPVEEQPA